MFASCSNKIGEAEVNPDRFKSFDQLEATLHSLGIKNFQSIFFIDFSKSNNFGQNHDVVNIKDNRYFKILSSLRTVIDKFDDDKIYPAYRFGCVRTRERTILPLAWDEQNMQSYTQQDAEYVGFDAVIQAYVHAVQNVTFAGPTSLCNLVNASINYSKAHPGEHILSFILCDGAMCWPTLDMEAVIEASAYPISFIAVSVGEVHDRTLECLDDLRGRKFDNFQYVNYRELEATLEKIGKRELKKSKSQFEQRDLKAKLAMDRALANEMFMELPDQFVQMVKLGYLAENLIVKRTGVVLREVNDTNTVGHE
ncbi:Copine_I [Hexamita inflata]|uniref:Copine I n=1 Tax=Hexamita inflata TaxID=28002 RepID=A0AA86Q7T2_9EUKA|nr:Copine I [Hexamita inflata]